MNAWIVVVAAGLGSYLFRLSMVAAADRLRLPARFDDAAELVAPAAFAALAMTSVASATLGAGWAEAIPPVAAVCVAVLAVVRTRSSHAAVLTGMPTLWITTALLAI